jgi:arsenite methyltransferase
VTRTPQPARENHEPLLDGLIEEVALRERVRARYANAARQAAAGAQANDCGCGQPAGCGCATSCCDPGETIDAPAWGPGLYTPSEQGELPETALLASLGCGNPTAVADLHEGETVLDLGSGGGIDVLLSAKRVGHAGKAYGLDMTEEMLALARRNAAEAGITNVEFLKGHIEQVPLPAGTVDVVISNCVINLSIDKPAVFAEMLRVLAPGGRIGISDVVAEDHLSPADRAERGSYVGCIAGALSRTEYQQGLVAAGFEQIEVTFTHQVADGLHNAIIKATKPDSPTSTQPSGNLAVASSPAGRTMLPLADERTTGCC